MKKFFVNKIENDLYQQVEAGLDWAGWESLVEKDSRVFIKPNFTFPFFKPGVTTSPDVIDAVVSVLARKT
ncbi:MAG: hypothetical protein Q8P48_03260, partial [Deltaproteobacteria bacterium]|nr:hypothetical protein [Deltaproteobacteria bacterium]